MGLLDKFRRKSNNGASAEDAAAKLADTAVHYAKSFQKTLDYSADSIKDLEEILDFYANDLLKSRPTENQIWSMALIFGSYLGEVMLKNGLTQKGYRWAREENASIPLLLGKNGSYVTPNDKVHKRLVNGAEDNVLSFYEFIMQDNP